MRKLNYSNEQRRTQPFWLIRTRLLLQLNQRKQPWTQRGEDWVPSFINFLRAIPDRDGVPLKYIIRDNDAADHILNFDFLDDYVANAPLNGAACVNDTALEHTHLINLIASNTEAESLVKVFEEQRNGRKD